MTTTAAPSGVGGGPDQSPPAAPSALDPVAAREVIEHYYAQGWTDGLPVVPCSESLLAEFLAEVDQDPDEIIFAMPHLNRTCSVRLAAVNAAMAGCRPEYFPVVLAAWAALAEEGYAGKGIWQSTTGNGTFLIVNGPARDRLEINSRGNIFGSGFRANATIGRAIRLTAINAFGLRPHVLDQATQGTPAKYTCCIAENEEESPWPALHTDLGFEAGQSAVTAMMTRSVVHIEARHTIESDQLLNDLANTVARTGALVHETISACVVLGPEHANLLARAGMSKADVRQALFDKAVQSRATLDAVGKGAVSRNTRWRIPREHPDAVLDGETDQVRVLNSPEAVVVVVAGASNAGVSAVAETFGPRGGPPATARVKDVR
ncbi:hypothetical protein [Plantactinospora soyae]|uniref:Uncharacterized protein n=1 Tax=Plantactinospora soyae TaxID=1544732 RepID=A0A927M866_9ACTN|nr:hypothetical protein [Plantactinospora soyae]MBE1489772.1 hypothetical protein [Plantactinospora soyae]